MKSFKMGKLVIKVVLVLLAVCRLIDCTCTFNEQTYNIGETWHPPAFESCVNCSCVLTETGVPEVKCVNKADKCPKLTCAIQRKDPNTCCPYCEDIPNIPPTVRGDIDESSSSNRESCTTSDGRVYKDGEEYPSNSTGIKPTSNQQCVMCVCQNGRSLCHLKTCSILPGCTSFINRSDHCCPYVQAIHLISLAWHLAGSFRLVTMNIGQVTEHQRVLPALHSSYRYFWFTKIGTHTGYKPGQREQGLRYCADSSGLKKNGTSWHPTLETFGEIECITCTCMDGEITCKKNCVPDHELPCPHPKKPNGECCKTCPSIANGQVQEKENGDQDGKDVKSERRKNRRKDRRKNGKKRRKYCKKEKNKNKRRCRRRNRKRNKKERSRKQRTTTPLLMRATTAPPGIDLANLCLKRKRKYLVYKAISDSELLIAFDDIAGEMVDVYRWKINKENKRGVISYTEPQVVPATEFRKTINNTNVVGTTGTKHYRKFKKRLKEKLDRCNSDCEPELFMKILQRVKVHLLKFGEECKT